MTAKIDILLSTYNGEKYVTEQLDSIVQQTYKEWRLIIRDDGSTDATPDIIRRYANSYPDQIILLTDCPDNLGVVSSYALLMAASEANYAAFCDQDDVWVADKLLLEITKMSEQESIHGTGVPVLIHTDLCVVDKEMTMISESFWRYQNLSPGKMSTLPRLLTQNCVTGCTVLINRPLLDLALPIPEGVIMHDWWVALIAVSEGVVCDMSVSTVYYRQHGANDTGAKQWGVVAILKRVICGRKPLMQSMQKTRVQAESLACSSVINDTNKRIVESYVSLYRHNWFRRRVEMLRMGFYKYGAIRNIAMLLYI